MATLFVPTVCPVCQRHSALPINKSELDQRLKSDEPVRMRCDYDDARWDATPGERLVMKRLSREDDTVRQRSRMPRPGTSTLQAGSPA